MANSGNTFTKSFQTQRFWFIPPMLFVGVMGGMVFYGYKTYFQPKTTFYQTDHPSRVLNAVAVESDEEKQIRKSLAERSETREGTFARTPATSLLQAEIKMTQDNEGVTYEVSANSPEAADLKIVVTARLIELSAKNAKKEVLLPQGVDHTRAQITKKDGKWMIKLPIA